MWARGATAAGLRGGLGHVLVGGRGARGYVPGLMGGCAVGGGLMGRRGREVACAGIVDMERREGVGEGGTGKGMEEAGGTGRAGGMESGDGGGTGGH